MKQLSLRSFAFDAQYSQLQEQLTLLMAPEARKSDVSEDESLAKKSARRDVLVLARKIYTCCHSLAAYNHSTILSGFNSCVRCVSILGAST